MLQTRLVVLLLITAVSAPAFSAEVPVQATLAMEAGLAAVDSAATPEDLGKAVEHFEKAVAIAPNWPDARYNLGKVLALMPDKSEEAIKALQAFLTISPQAPEAKAVEVEIGQIEKRMALIHKQGSILRELKLAQLKDGIYVVDLNGSIKFSRNRGQFINGLQRGDKIETVNGRPTKGMRLDEFYSIVADGSPGGHICFVRLRGGADPFELSLKRENLYQGVEAFRKFQTPCPK